MQVWSVSKSCQRSYFEAKWMFENIENNIRPLKRSKIHVKGFKTLDATASGLDFTTPS